MYTILERLEKIEKVLDLEEGMGKLISSKQERLEEIENDIIKIKKAIGLD